jgi:hypothetical protein
MTMIEKIRGEMVAAMKAKDKLRKDALSALLTSLKNAAIDKREDLTEAEENAIIKKEMKQLKETLEACPADHEELIAEMQGRLDVLAEFAPEEMSEEQILATIQEVLTTLGIDTPTAKDKGKIMKELMPKVKGKADGALVNQLVTKVMN